MVKIVEVIGLSNNVDKNPYLTGLHLKVYGIVIMMKMYSNESLFLYKLGIVS
jgi:hypothetical protein